MVETKYGKYFIQGPKPGSKGPFVTPSLGDDRLPGSLQLTFSFIKPGASSRMHDPHSHPHPEVLAWFSSDMNAPNELGGVVEIYMGEEMEHHVITKSTILYLPPDLIHCPLVFRDVEKPFIFIMTAPVGKLVEKTFKNLLPDEKKGKKAK
jgi:hypothetical protein